MEYYGEVFQESFGKCNQEQVVFDEAHKRPSKGRRSNSDGHGLVRTITLVKFPNFD